MPEKLSEELSRGIHPLDIALWGAEKELAGPVEVKGTGVFPADGVCDTATNWNVVLTFAGNAEGLTLGRVTIKAGKANPRHRHLKSEEVLYLLNGRLNHTLVDKTITMSAGDVITIPPAIFHNAACIGAEDADMIVVYSQGTRRFELEKSP